MHFHIRFAFHEYIVSLFDDIFESLTAIDFGSWLMMAEGGFELLCMYFILLFGFL